MTCHARGAEPAGATCGDGSRDGGQSCRVRRRQLCGDPLWEAPPAPPAARSSLPTLLLWAIVAPSAVRRGESLPLRLRGGWEAFGRHISLHKEKQTDCTLSTQKMAYQLASLIKGSELMEPCLPPFECPEIIPPAGQQNQQGARYVFNHLCPVGIAICQQGQLLPPCNGGEGLKAGKLWLQNGVLPLLMSGRSDNLSADILLLEMFNPPDKLGLGGKRGGSSLFAVWFFPEWRTGSGETVG